MFSQVIALRVASVPREVLALETRASSHSGHESDDARLGAC